MQHSTNPRGVMKVFRALLRAMLLAPPVSAATFLVAWYLRETFGGFGEAFSLFCLVWLVMAAATVVVTLLLLLAGMVARQAVPAMAHHTTLRALLFGGAGGVAAAGVILLLLHWLPSGSEVFSVAMLSGAVGGIVAGLATEAIMEL